MAKSAKIGERVIGTLRRDCLPSFASRRRSPSVNRSRGFPSRSKSAAFSARWYSITRALCSPNYIPIHAAKNCSGSGSGNSSPQKSSPPEPFDSSTRRDPICKPRLRRPASPQHRLPLSRSSFGTGRGCRSAIPVGVEVSPRRYFGRASRGARGQVTRDTRFSTGEYTSISSSSVSIDTISA
jgi:hypothetical protein